jgi:hypothetical protein
MLFAPLFFCQVPNYIEHAFMLHRCRIEFKTSKKTACKMGPMEITATTVPNPTFAPSSQPVNSAIPSISHRIAPIGSPGSFLPNATIRESLGPQPIPARM